MLRLFIFTIALLLSAFASASERPYSTKAFADLQQQQAPILVFIHADWCPVCNRQAVILSELFDRAEFKPITLLRVDFDNQKSVVERFGVTYQSTLIVFRKGKEVARSTADTDKRRIAALLRRTLRE
jgi:thioredoxin 1